jgi:hypothetical protein
VVFDINEPVETMLVKLHELGLQANEMKRLGIDSVPLISYEKLIDWAIDFTTNINDAVMKNK